MEKQKIEFSAQVDPNYMRPPQIGVVDGDISVPILIPGRFKAEGLKFLAFFTGPVKIFKVTIEGIDGKKKKFTEPPSRRQTL